MGVLLRGHVGWKSSFYSCAVIYLDFTFKLKMRHIRLRHNNSIHPKCYSYVQPLLI